MQTINLKQYYPFCKEDIFVEVSDEIVEAFLLDKRAEGARDRKMFRYKAFYSLDCNDGIENAAIGWAQPSPEDYLIEKEELAEYEELIDVYKRQAIKRGLKIELLEQVLALLAMGEPLPDKNRDHDLSGDWAGHRECHILPDWLLIYRIEDDVLVLTLARTGSHSDLFGK